MEFFIYLIKASVALILFYIVYQLLSGMDTFFRVKRALLLFTLFFSALFPFLAFSFVVSNDSGLTALMANAMPEYLLKEVTVYADGVGGAGLSAGQVLLLVYGTGVIVFSIRMLIEMISIARIILRSQKTLLQGRQVYVNNRVKAPFSFFSWIVINPENHTGDEITEILLHEETHVREYHSIDTLASELYCIVFWFNPAAWLMKKEVRMNLEYLADRQVISSGCDTQHYQFHLLRLSYHKAAAKLSNNFNVSPLKQRILMMNKNRTHIAGLAKYAFFIPLAAMLLLFFNCQKETVAANNEISAALQDTIKVAEPPELSEEMLSKLELKQVPVVTPKAEPAPVKAEKPEKETVKFVEPVMQDEKKEDIPSPKLVFEKAEEMPQYPGGDKALYTYLAENLVYPAEEAKRGVQGTVVIRFTVEKDGSVGEIQVLRGVSPELDAEAIRVVKAIPAFIPGKQDGEPVAVWFTMPVRFKLS